MAAQDNNITRLGVFGGSFNPPTLAHLMLAEYLMPQYVDKVLFLPVGDSYQKPVMAAAVHRLAMLQLAVTPNPGFILSELETSQDKVCYSYDSLQTLQKEYPATELYFLIGSDQLPGLWRWYRIEDLLHEFYLIILARGEDNPQEVLKTMYWLTDYQQRLVICEGHPYSNLSSTLLRQRLAAFQSIRYMTLPSIAAYIQQNGLYLP